MKLKEANEFRLIRQFFQAKQTPSDSVIQGIGDDCAVLKAATQPLAISVDTSIADRHFPFDANAFDIGARALNVALSDLAAMGAKPKYFTLAMTIPRMSEDWLADFSNGLFQAADRFSVELIGGDTTRAANDQVMAFSVTVFGLLEEGQGLYRHGARAGDYLYVSGTLGDAALGLDCYFDKVDIHDDDKAFFLDAYLRPQPEIDLGLAIAKLASSCIDISDGFLQDLGHILTASSVGADIDISKIPLSKALTDSCSHEKALTLALMGGDDYKLCFTSVLSPESIAIEDVHCIGRIKAEKAIDFINSPMDIESIMTTTGFDHFHAEDI